MKTAADSGQLTAGSKRLSAVCCLLCLLVLSCTDPRARPAAPILQVDFAPSFRLTSPGILSASLYAFDQDGIARLNLTVVASGALFTADSSLLLTGDVEVTRPIVWLIPPGLPTGTQVRLVARALDFEGFASSDTTFLVVQDSVLTTR